VAAEKIAAPERVLALDYGRRRIGLAVSDPDGTTALGLPTLERTSLRHDLEVLGKIARKHQVARLVLGCPLNMDGTAGSSAEKVESFATRLREKLKLPVELVDERLTSWQANELLDQQKLSRVERKDKVDKIAAVLILEAYLAARRP
jgi:putative Holliday junction resolvase